MAGNESAWNRVVRARDNKRPYSLDYINNIFDWFLEMHGDRLYGDDRAVVGGIAALGKRYVTVIGHQKGRNAKENQYRNFGMANPEGYRKALRLMKQAEKFHRPIILFVDTPGAFCGVEAEERGQGAAIANNLYEMSSLKVPVLTIIIGEGSSGGALGLAVSNEVWMFENAVYSILSPEGFAAILWRDGKRAKEAAEVMKLTAKDLKNGGIIEKIIAEKEPVRYEYMDEHAKILKSEILDFLQRYEDKTEEQIYRERYERFRRMGNQFIIEGNRENRNKQSSWLDRLDVPVFQGGMGIGISLGGLAGAVAANGGAGTVAAAQVGFKEPDFETNPLEANLRALGKEIAKARQIAAGRGAIGVNIMAATSQYEMYVKEALNQKVDFIVSGAGLPMNLPAITKDSDVKIIPIVSSVRAASVICKRWLKKDNRLPDAVIIEGVNAGGHLGFSMEEALESVKSDDAKEKYRGEVIKIIEFLRKFGEENGQYIPVISAGGYRTHEDLKEQLALGADAVQIATSFVTTEECDADIKFKEAYVNCSKDDITIVKSPVGMPGRAVRNAFVEETQQHRIQPKKCYNCIPHCKPDQTPYCITAALIDAAKGDTDNGLVFCGANAWQEDRIRTVKEVIDIVTGKN